MAYYPQLGDCAACEAIFPGGNVTPPPPVVFPPAGPSTSTSVFVERGGAPVVCPAAPSRWWLWLVIGLGIGYLANE